MAPDWRYIFHCDLDAFYASVEQLDNPQLRGKPVVVGGPPESRGVVAATSYEARKFGIHSAMPMGMAMRLCLYVVRVPARFERYHQVSRQVMGIYRAVTALVEPLSLDEAHLDVTTRAEWPQVQSLASSIKAQVRYATGLAVTVGGGTGGLWPR
jgi:DNA polymerase-4